MSLQISKVDAAPPSRMGYVSVKSEDGKVDASFWFGEGIQQTEQEAERQARLFAAAADMLAALRAVDTYLAADGTTQRLYRAHFMNGVRAAIAKAEGAL